MFESRIFVCLNNFGTELKRISNVHFLMSALSLISNPLLIFVIVNCKKLKERFKVFTEIAKVIARKVKNPLILISKAPGVLNSKIR